MLGLIWALVEPLGFMVIYLLVFSLIINLKIRDYPIFLLCGILPWIYFSKSLNCTDAIIKDRLLVRKIYFPREVLPISSVLARLVNFIISLFLLAFFLLIFNKLHFSYLPCVILIIFVQTLLSIGLALILSSLNVYFQDVKLLLDFVILLWFYCSPVFYPIDMVPLNLRNIYALNPMAGILVSYRNIFFYNISPLTKEFYMASIISLFVFLLGFEIFNRLDRRIGDLV